MFTSGCKKWVTVKMMNHYSSAVDVYDASASPNYSPQLLGEIAPNAIATFQVVGVPNGRNYHFMVRTLNGRVIKEVVEPGEQINSFDGNNVWTLELGSKPIN